MTKVPISERTFIRGLVAYDKDNKEISRLIAQPYCIGMYVYIEPNTIQLNLRHKEYPNWVKGSIKKMEKKGLRIEVHELKYVAFLTEKEIIDYEVLKP